MKEVVIDDQAVVMLCGLAAAAGAVPVVFVFTYAVVGPLFPLSILKVMDPVPV